MNTTLQQKEKAEELYLKFRGCNNETEKINHITAKQIAYDCVNEITNALKPSHFQNDITYLIDWWVGVKQEIYKL